MTVERNALEAAAFQELLDRLGQGVVRLVYSSFSFGEGVPRDGRESASRSALLAVIELRSRGMHLVQHDERADTSFVAAHLYRAHRIGGHDALHAAAALLEGAWYLVSGDDRLRRRFNRLSAAWGIPTTADTPVGVVARLNRGGVVE